MPVRSSFFPDARTISITMPANDSPLIVKPARLMKRNICEEVCRRGASLSVEFMD